MFMRFISDKTALTSIKKYIVSGCVLFVMLACVASSSMAWSGKTACNEPWCKACKQPFGSACKAEEDDSPCCCNDYKGAEGKDEYGNQQDAWFETVYHTGSWPFRSFNCGGVCTINHATPCSDSD